MSSLLHSRKFQLMLLDVTVSIVTYFVSRYAGEMAANDVLWLIGVLQPVFVSVITGIAIEDHAAKSKVA